MAGQPIRRQREREAEQAAARAAGRAMPRAKTTDAATRRATVERAAVVGDGAAAAEVGVSKATVRSWRRRLKSEPAQAATLTPSGEIAPETGVDGVAQMRSTAAHARDLAEEAARQSRGLMRAGEAIKVRELSASAKMWAATAASLEQAIAVASGADSRLGEARARLMADVVRTFFQQVVGSLDAATRSVLRELLEQAGAGAPLAVAPEKAAAARREIQASFIKTIPAQTPPAELAEPDEPDDDTAVEPAAPPPTRAAEETAAEQAVEPEIKTLTIEEVRPELQARYPIQPALAVAAELHQRRLDRAGGHGVLRRSRSDLTHPGLRGAA